MLRTIQIATALTALSLSGSAIGATFSLGAIGTRTSSVYKDVGPQNGGFPFVSISSGQAYLKGNELGVKLRPDGAPLNVSVGLEYNTEGFDPSDSTNAAMQSLDKRKGTGMVNAKATYHIFFGKIALDIGDRHDGYYALVGVGYPIMINAWTLTPSYTYKYLDKKMSTYLYGVSREESIRTAGIFPEYRSTDTRQSTFSFRADYTVSPRLSVLMGVSHTDYKAVLDSPIVSRAYTYEAYAGLVYTF